MYPTCHTVVFVAASHQTRLDTRSKARRPIKVGIKGRGMSGRSRDSNPACQCCSSAHLVQCEPDEASSFTNPNVSPGTYASLRLKLDAWSSAVQRGQKCSSPTRRLPSRSWGPIRPRVCSWFRAPIRHECQTAQLKSQERAHPTCHTVVIQLVGCDILLSLSGSLIYLVPPIWGPTMPAVFLLHFLTWFIPILREFWESHGFK